MSDNLELFEGRIDSPREEEHTYGSQAPLADRLRPKEWKDFVGLENVDTNLVHQLQEGSGRPPSLILWGPPGTGKTTLARLIGESFDCHFVSFSAVLGGVKDVREIIAKARRIPLQTVLFVDEIHRFNKAQQDAFLPHVENGTIVLIGATTENPSFYLNSALLSRARVVPLTDITPKGLQQILTRAVQELSISLSDEAMEFVISFVGGDARRMLNLVESFVESRTSASKDTPATRKDLEEFLQDAHTNFYDRDGEEHYNMASAFIKSMRGSDPDAALYWAFRMIESGEDPRFIIRRMIVFASEDIGNADPKALPLAVSTADAFDKIGLPEGKIPIAQCVTYLSCAPKSNRSYEAMHRVLGAISEHPKAAVPLHLRNAPTKLMKEMGYSKGYTYPHHTDEKYVAGEQYLPDVLKGERFYDISSEGYEQRMAEWMKRRRSLEGRS